MFWSSKRATDFVSVVFNDQSIIIAQVTKNNSKNPVKSTIKFLEKIELSSFEIIDLKIFNLTCIYKFIKEFIDKHKLKNCDVIFCLGSNYNLENNSGILEEILTKEKYHENIDLNSQGNLKFSQVKLGELIYSAGIPYFILFQYQLLAINLKINLIYIVTDSASLASFLTAQDIESLYLELLENKSSIISFKNKLEAAVNKIDFKNINYIGPNIDKFVLAQILGVSKIFELN